MKRMKWMSLVLAVSISAGFLVGCGQGEHSKAPAGTTDTSSANLSTGVGEIEEITFVTNSSSNNVFAGDNEALNQAAIDYVEKQTGIRLNVIAIPHNSYQEKINLMLSSGDAIDVFLLQNAREFASMNIRRGYMADITEFINSSDNLSRVEKSYYDALSHEGKIYGIPMLSPANQILYVRKDILDKYDVKVPLNTDEFYTEFKKLADQGVVPLCLPKWINNIQFFFNSFDAWRGLRLSADGKWVDGFCTPEMKEALEYMRLLYKDGILDQEFITNENAKMREKYISGSAACCLYWGHWYTSAIMEPKTLNPEAESVAITALAGPEGQKGGALNQSIQDAYAVYAKSNKKEAAVKVLDWLTASPEGVMLSSVGVEGVHYSFNENGEIEMTKASQDVGFPLSTVPLLSSIIPEGVEVSLPAELQDAYNQNKELMPSIYKNMGPWYKVPAGLSDTYDKIEASYLAKLDEFITDAILNGDIEKVMEDYEAYWNSIDGDAILAELNK